MATGGEHTCALTTEGGLKCWGDNYLGQLGNGTTTNSSSTPVDVSGLSSGVAAVATGGEHTCALTTGGGLKCWGANGGGQLGDGTTTYHSTPVDVSGLSSGVAAVAAGEDHTCALTTGGGLKCWGWNSYGQLGDGTTTSRTTPVDVVGLTSGVAAVSAGERYTCAVTTGHVLKCWGQDWYGQLGDGSTTSSSTPVDVSGLTSGVAAVAAGTYHACALTTGGGLECWGYNGSGQLGDGTTTSMRTIPVDVSGLASGMAAVSAGGSHTCALTTGGGLKCWGADGSGQLGDGTTNSRSTPVDVSGLTSGVTAVSAGGSHTCALTTGGGLKCWGYNNFGELGDGTLVDRHTPVDVVDFGGGPSPTSTPTPTGTPPTVTPTPTSIRPPVNPHIDKTVNGQQGPITVTLGDSVTYRWVITGDRYFHAWVDDDTHDALDKECNSWDPCEQTAIVTFLTPGPVTDTVHAEVAGIPPYPGYGLDESAWDSVTVNVVTPTPTPTPGGYTVAGQVCEFPPPEICGALRGATVTLDPLGWTTTTSYSDGSFAFSSVPDGDYTLTVTPRCTPYGCYDPTSVTVAGADTGRQFVPVPFTPTPTPTPTPNPGFDADGDGCADVQELGSNKHLGGQRDPLNPYDFYDITDSTFVVGAKDKAVSSHDLSMLLSYGGTSDGGPCNAAGNCYDDDKNGNGTDDGREMDFASIHGPASGPDGAISAFDLSALLTQGGDSCAGPPSPTPTSTPTPAMTPTATPTPNPAQPAINAAIQATIDLVGYYTQVVSVEPVDWPDTCLGLPEPGEVCLDVIMPGYRITITAGSATLVWHTDDDGSEVRLEW